MSPEEIAFHREEAGIVEATETDEERAIMLIQDCVNECFRRSTTNWKQSEMALIKEIAMDYVGDECSMEHFGLEEHVKRLKTRYNSEGQRRYITKCTFDLLNNWQKEINLAYTYKD